MMIDKIIEALKTVYDPEISVNVYDLGLVYDIRIDGDKVDIDMTVTTPFCPFADQIPVLVKDAVIRQVEGINDVNVKIVFEPVWNVDMMSDEARTQLNMFNW